MSRGRAVVSSAVGGVPDVVRDGVDRYLVPPRDPQVRAERLIQALEQPARERVGKAAQERVWRDFSWAEVARRAACVYRSLVATAQPSYG